MEQLSKLEDLVAKAIATNDDQLIVRYDAWTAACRVPVEAFSQVTGLDFKTDAEGEAHVKGLFDADKLKRLRDVFEKFVNNPIALALLRAWLKI